MPLTSEGIEWRFMGKIPKVGIPAWWQDAKHESDHNVDSKLE